MSLFEQYCVECPLADAVTQGEWEIADMLWSMGARAGRKYVASDGFVLECMAQSMRMEVCEERNAQLVPFSVPHLKYLSVPPPWAPSDKM